MKTSGKTEVCGNEYRTTTLQIGSCTVNIHRPVLSREDRERAEEQLKTSMLLLAEAAEAAQKKEEAV